MSGEDVYDVAHWCHICDENHPDCEPSWLDADCECVICNAKITDEQYDLDGIGFCDEHRPAVPTDPETGAVHEESGAV